MLLSEFREKTKNLPDNTEVVVDMGDLDFYSLDFKYIFAAIMDTPTTIWLEGVERVNIALDMEARVDAYLGM